MKFVFIAIFAALLMTACLPDVGTELSEEEARALIEREVLNTCDGRSTNFISGILASVGNSTAIPSQDWWTFSISMTGSDVPLEARVFPSKIVSGPFVVHLVTQACG
jgi:hypothetical protein